MWLSGQHTLNRATECSSIAYPQRHHLACGCAWMCMLHVVAERARAEPEELLARADIDEEAEQRHTLQPTEQVGTL